MVHEFVMEVSRNDALKDVLMTKWADEFNMDTYGREDNPMLKDLNKILLCNRLRLCIKL